MNRIFQREYKGEEYEDEGRRFRIGVVGLNEGNGATLFATSLACIIEEKKECSVAYLEFTEGMPGKPLLFDSLAMDRRFASRKFHDVYSLVRDKKRTAGIKNKDENINWLIMSPESAAKGLYMTGKEKMKVLAGITEDVTVCDIDDKEDLDEVLQEMDIIAAVIDPMPSKLIAARGLIRKIKAVQAERKSEKMPVCWILNRCSRGVGKRKLNEYLKVRETIKIPEIKGEWFYTAEYNCRIPFRQREIGEKIEKPIKEFINHHITIT